MCLARTQVAQHSGDAHAISLDEAVRRDCLDSSLSGIHRIAADAADVNPGPLRETCVPRVVCRARAALPIGANREPHLARVAIRFQEQGVEQTQLRRCEVWKGRWEVAAWMRDAGCGMPVGRMGSEGAETRNPEPGTRNAEPTKRGAACLSSSGAKVTGLAAGVQIVRSTFIWASV